MFKKLPDMNPESLIHKYYASQPELEQLLLRHSHDVADRAMRIAGMHSKWHVDTTFLYEAAMLHDIGILYVNAPSIHCHGDKPYILHGILGAELLRREGLPQHARVAERHTGTGLTREDIEAQSLPLPPGDYRPETLEEQIVCYADKFYSKSRPEEEKDFAQALRSLEKFGPKGLEVFKRWKEQFE